MRVTISIERLDGRPLARAAIPPLLASAAAAAPPEPVHVSGPDAERLVILFLGDSYKGPTRQRYPTDVAAHAESRS